MISESNLNDKISIADTELLFKTIRDNPSWKPESGLNYSKYNIFELKKMADDWFDKLHSQGFFFHDYNEVLERIELLSKYKNKNQKEK